MPIVTLLPLVNQLIRSLNGRLKSHASYCITVLCYLVSVDGMQVNMCILLTKRKLNLKVKFSFFLRGEMLQ